MTRIFVVAFLTFIIVGCVVPSKLQNISKTKTLFAECKCADSAECNDVGVKYELDGNLSAAKKCYKVACEGKIGVACSNLGSIYQIHNSKSESEILSIFLRSCEFGSKYGCYNAANLYRLSSAPNYDEAIRLYKKSCEELEHAQSCSNLGGMYQFSLGVNTADYETAKKYYKMGCEMGDEVGCRNLSLIGGN